MRVKGPDRWTEQICNLDRNDYHRQPVLQVGRGESCESEVLMCQWVVPANDRPVN